MNQIKVHVISDQVINVVVPENYLEEVFIVVSLITNTITIGGN